ncbi:hypothetical protein V8J88_24370 [Massilia sp. W12]|uniref:hypothetical protein n=1 Tax=Massilia sp. W12 TaxID=3126507 RepID=UPI0030CE0E2F
MTIKTIEMSNKEITYTLIALKKYEKELLSQDGELAEDAGNDIIFIQAIIERLSQAKKKE